MGTFTKQPESIRRLVILEAAGRLFRERGYDATNMSAIADAANLSKGGLYFHFPSKEALLLATLTHEMDTFEQQVEERAATASDPPQRLALYVSEHLQDLGKTLSLDLWAEALRIPGGAEILREAYCRDRDRLVALLRHATDESTKVVSTTDSDYVSAVLLIALLDGLDLEVTIDPECLPPIEALTAAIFRVAAVLSESDVQ